MSSDLQRQIQLFEAAMELPPNERKAYLASACGDDQRLLEVVLALITTCEELEVRSAAGKAALPVSAGGTVLARQPLPERIGRYRVIGVLGEGGMGTVYEAEQENPKRAVALKVIRAGSLSADMLRRFAQESAVLGRLQHTGIAQVFEAGTIDDERGRPMPFFAMEFIRGVSLTEYATVKKLGTRQRFELMAKVCDAVYHAHQKGVIHRDLKPGNILVDETGQPKVLDFGVARATDSDIQQTTLRTDIGQLIGTVPYMSPEQVSGDPNELDTRSDVYALGVIAYELVAGKLPYDLKKKLIHEAVRVIREDEPTRLSSVDPALRGDVETIVAKALEKDKTRRYQSAESLASDIRRYLKDEPIAARPASTWYQVRMFSRRNRGLVAGVATAFVLLIAGVMGIGLALNRALIAESDLKAQLSKTKIAEEVASAQRDTAQTALDSNQKLLKASYFDAATLASQRGNWKGVLDAADSARAAGVGEDVRFLLLRIRAFASLQRLDAAEQELKTAKQHPDAARVRAELLLWEADLRIVGLTSKDKNFDSEAAIAEAIRLGLPPAREAYAKAMLAPELEGARVLLRESIMQDPFDTHMHGMLGILSYLMADANEAERCGRTLCVLEPAGVEGPILVALASLIRGDDAATEEAVAAVKKLGVPEADRALKSIRVAITLLREGMKQAEQGKDGLSPFITLVTTAEWGTLLVQVKGARALRIGGISALGATGNDAMGILTKNPLRVFFQPQTILRELAGVLDRLGPNWKGLSLLVKYGDGGGMPVAEAIALLEAARDTPAGLVDVRKLAGIMLTGSVLQETYAKNNPEFRPKLRSLVTWVAANWEIPAQFYGNTLTTAACDVEAFAEAAQLEAETRTRHGDSMDLASVRTILAANRGEWYGVLAAASQTAQLTKAPAGEALGQISGRIRQKFIDAIRAAAKAMGELGVLPERLEISFPGTSQFLEPN